jgi:riboflavin kinase/FMN adenylyltransferase
MMIRFAPVAVGISCYCKAGVEFGFDVTSTKPSVKAACASAARRYVRRWRTTICLAETPGHPFTISGRVVHGDELGAQ